jgi:NAD(P)-dependent dehydrogenase (short-subunit alcohol dehydrogenase family)
MFNLEDKVAIVTGASAGIGRETAIALVDCGASVVLGDIDSVRGEELADQLRDKGGEVMFVAVDVSVDKPRGACE